MSTTSANKGKTYVSVLPQSVVQNIDTLFVRMNGGPHRWRRRSAGQYASGEPGGLTRVSDEPDGRGAGQGGRGEAADGAVGEAGVAQGALDGRGGGWGCGDEEAA